MIVFDRSLQVQDPGGKPAAILTIQHYSGSFPTYILMSVDTYAGIFNVQLQLHYIALHKPCIARPATSRHRTLVKLSRPRDPQPQPCPLSRLGRRFKFKRRQALHILQLLILQCLKVFCLPRESLPGISQ